MCVIAALPQKKTLDKDMVESMWKRNSDGGGFSYIHPSGELKVYKTMNFEKYWSTFNGVQQEFGEFSDILLHFRIATHGVTDISNVHPFQVDEHTVMAHNGIISSVRDDKILSDTRVFAEEYLNEMPETWLDNPVLVQMVEKFIGHSKLMFLTTNPNLKKEVYILNENMGTKRDGIWFSNAHHLPSPGRSTSYGSHYGGWLDDDDDWETYRYFSGGYGKPEYRQPVKQPTAQSTQKAVTTFRAPYSKEREDLLRAERLQILDLDHDIGWSETTRAFICEACMAPIKEESYSECMCFDKACTTCLNYTAACDDICKQDPTRKVYMPNDYRFQRILDEADMSENDVLNFDKYTVCEVVNEGGERS